MISRTTHSIEELAAFLSGEPQAAAPAPCAPSFPENEERGEFAAPIEIPIDRPDGRRSTHVLSLKGTYHRFAVGHIGEGSEARQVTDGPMVPGPWAYAYGLASVIDNHGGTGAEIERNLAEGREHEVEDGTLLRIAGHVYRVEVFRREHLNLIREDDDEEQWRADMRPEIEYRGELKETAISTWTLPKSRYPEIDDVKVALDEAGFSVEGYHDGPGKLYAEPMDFEEHDDENWTVIQYASWDV